MTPSNIIIKRATDPNDIEACLKIRKEVFVIEQGISADIEPDAQDRAALHFLALLNGHPAGAARVLMRNDRTARIGRVAVLRPQRGLGIGGKLMDAIEKDPELKTIESFVLHAQLHAVSFYQRLGYEIHGEEFISEAGKRARVMKKRNPAYRKFSL